MAESATISDFPQAHEERIYSRSDWYADQCFDLASLMTDPVCKVDELYARLFVPFQDDFGYEEARKALLVLGIIGFGAISAVTGPVGLALRALGCYLQTHPFQLIETGAPAKKLEGNRFTLLSWNICGVGGGYPITDGGVPSWPSRIDAITREIIGANADVVCLYETFDRGSVIKFSDALKKAGYTHIYRNIGPRVLGVNSGILVASKFETENPEFEAFPIETLVGRTKNATKGVFSFSLKNIGSPFARIFTTHMQHSDEPEYPTPEEIAARAAQMRIIADKMNLEKKDDICSALTGDWNLDDKEYNGSSWKDLFDKGNLNFKGMCTWGGDEFCAKLSNCRSVASSIMALFTNIIWGTPIEKTLGQKKPSGPLNLDHTVKLKGTIGQIVETHLIDTHFDHTKYRSHTEDGQQITSDHRGIFSTFVLPSDSKL